MINYVVNFTLCSGLLLLTYQLLLKNITTYNFNRFYLLFSVVFSLAVPFMTITRTSAPLPSLPAAQQQLPLAPTGVVQSEIPVSVAAPAHEAPLKPGINYILYITIAIYGIATLLLLYRFIKNLNTIRSSVSGNQKIAFQHAWLVLIENQLTPHTFLNYIFIDKKAYSNNQVEANVLKHELTHAQQRHSIDIIFIELVQAICWFNPFIILYRKAIQLNHEFIADAAVLNSNRDVSAYQHLLLEKIGYNTSLGITSQFNYSVTKKRLIMMSKKTSAITAMLVRLAVIPVMAIAFVLFCTKTEAQQEPTANKAPLKVQDIKLPQFIVRDNPLPNQIMFQSAKEGATKALLDEYKSIAGKYEKAENGRVAYPEKITATDREKMIAIYKQMSKEQQQQQAIGFTQTAPPPPVPESKVPSQKELDLWKTSAGYQVWIDTRKIKNSDLAHYKITDLYCAFVYPVARVAHSRSPRKYTVNIWTNSYCVTYRKWASSYQPETKMFFRYSARQHNVSTVPVCQFPFTEGGISDEQMKAYSDLSSKYIVANNLKHLIMAEADKSKLEELFKQMSKEQQDQQIIGFVYQRNLLPQNSPSQAELDLWKGNAAYAVWLNNKRLKNSGLSGYHPADFGYVLVTDVTPNEADKGKHQYQVDLTTIEEYKNSVKRINRLKDISIITYGYNQSIKKVLLTNP